MNTDQNSGKEPKGTPATCSRETQGPTKSAPKVSGDAEAERTGSGMEPPMDADEEANRNGMEPQMNADQKSGKEPKGTPATCSRETQGPTKSAPKVSGEDRGRQSNTDRPDSGGPERHGHIDAGQHPLRGSEARVRRHQRLTPPSSPCRVPPVAPEVTGPTDPALFDRASARVRSPDRLTPALCPRRPGVGGRR